jgi:predicted HicB family RNase H-like nuclease
MVRLPKELHARITREVGRRMQATGRRVSLNTLLVEALDKAFRPTKGREGRR